MRLIIGLMSGTSVDAIDAALVCITPKSLGNYAAKILHHTEHPWPKKIRQRLLAIMAPAATTTQELCELNTLVAREFAQAVETLLQQSRTPRKKITALASHGQTICHLPPETQNAKRMAQNLAIGSTLQIGDPSVLATLTGIPTVANFRPADIALGGQGAPLVPFADAVLLSHPMKIRCIQNIGGIANVTYLPMAPKKKALRHKGTKALREETSPPNPLSASVPLCLSAFPPVLAFDTGPGNMLIDALISIATGGKQRYDKNGHLAARGVLDIKLFRQLQSHPYFSRKPPKSTGREDFGLPFAQKLLTTGHWPLTTLLTTATRLTAWSIVDAYTCFLPTLPDEVILCGGGADNPTLVQMLAEEFSHHKNPPTIARIDDFGIPNKAKEAASFALLAAATLDGIPANLPSVTGAAHPTVLGIIAPATSF